MPQDRTLRNRTLALQFARMGKLTGYTFLLLAVVLFGWSYATEFSNASVIAIEIAMSVASVALLPSIVIGYAAKAAEREDRRQFS